MSDIAFGDADAVAVEELGGAVFVDAEVASGDWLAEGSLLFLLMSLTIG